MPDHFEVLGLPRKFHLDAADLESRYLSLQKETHARLSSGVL